jgi:hypothetical protein
MLSIMIARPSAHGRHIHEPDPLFHPGQRQRTGRLVAVIGQGQDDASARERLVPAFEHEEVPGIGEQPLLIDIAVVVFAEALWTGSINPPTCAGGSPVSRRHRFR